MFSNGGSPKPGDIRPISVTRGYPPYFEVKPGDIRCFPKCQTNRAVGLVDEIARESHKAPQAAGSPPPSPIPHAVGGTTRWLVDAARQKGRIQAVFPLAFIGLQLAPRGLLNIVPLQIVGLEVHGQGSGSYPNHSSDGVLWMR